MVFDEVDDRIMFSQSAVCSQLCFGASGHSQMYQVILDLPVGLFNLPSGLTNCSLHKVDVVPLYPHGRQFLNGRRPEMGPADLNGLVFHGGVGRLPCCVKFLHLQICVASGRLH